MSVKTFEILEQLKSLTLLEASELVKQIEVTFGVDASPKTMFYNSVVSPVDEFSCICIPPAPTEVNVILDHVPAQKKIAILKVVRTLMGLGLKEAKDFVESAPQVVKEAITPETAEEIKQQLELAGAGVSVQ
ncbi:MAG: 50S ribosomal protein L7/L12 [Coleofasciculus sp. G3-WIS-01]|uniref:50S ribosomal protein L7/L12 n=1 Tax=Coleofasciculus sp. G3-WIS-01 TaxID=3069528 RepID=UPI0032F1ACFF